MSPNQIDIAAKRLVEQVGKDAEIVVIFRTGKTIQMRDNSGQEGLTGEPLMNKTLDLLDELFS